MDKKLLKTLSETPGVPGREEPIRAVVKEELSALTDTLSVDAMGNLIGLKKGKGTLKVMLAAHMDEIGFLVKHIDKKGYIHLQNLGGFDPRQLFAQRVFIRTRQGKSCRGVLSYATKPVHLQTAAEQSKPPQISKFFVDLGMSEKRVKKQISVGDIVTMDRTLETCEDTFIGKSLDNRIGVYVMLEALKTVRNHEVDIYAVATVQEEVGLRGATTAAFTVDPDIGIALDTTLANDQPGQSDPETVTRLHEGVAIKIMDSAIISHPKLVDHLKEIAERENIPHQMEILPRGGTDGGPLQRTRGGTVSITISIPTRYIHTVNEMVSKKDVEAAVKLLALYLEEAHTGDYGL